MVKLQKPNPKTFNKGANKPKKSNNFKKEKVPEAKKAIPATNATAKKEKIKLIEKVVNEKPKVSAKPTKNVDKINENPKVSLKPSKNLNKISEKPEVSAKPTKNVSKNKKATDVQQEEPIFKKVDKKKIKNKAQIKEAVVETNVGPKQLAKKTPKAIVDLKPAQQKVGKKNNKKAPATPAGKGKKQVEDVNGKGPAVKAASAAPTAKGKKKKQAAGKGQKKSAVPDTVFDAVPFDEDKFSAIVNLENIKKVSGALKTMVEKEVSEKKNSIFEDFRYLLNVVSFKIPNCPKRIVKLNLAHSLVDPNEDDVVMIVPDLQRGAKVDYEPTIQHYEDLFRENGVTGLKIVPFNQLRQECTTFESKRKFVSTYDYFLCDGRIVSHVVGFGGSSFQRTRTTFHAVHMNNNKKTYKRDVEKALKRTAFKQLHKGDLISIPVGNHRFTVDQLADNIKLVVDQLKTLYPGGLGNIRNLHVKIDITGTSSLPLYASLAAAPAETPNVIGIREQRMLKLKREANEVLSQFNMSKTGEFVKLNKAQAERKRKILEARKAVLTEGLSDSVECKDGEEPTKKSKKSKCEEKQDESDEEEDVVNEDESEEVDEEDNDEDEEDDDDDAASDDEE